jgi:hypothetical protein
MIDFSSRTLTRVHLVCFVYLVDLVHLVSFVQPENQTNQITVSLRWHFLHHPAAFVYHNHLQGNNLDRRSPFP